ncbi:MAG: hypothetical protein AAB503_00685 [Patescibacteria group bacterium]
MDKGFLKFLAIFLILFISAAFVAFWLLDRGQLPDKAYSMKLLDPPVQSDFEPEEVFTAFFQLEYAPGISERRIEVKRRSDGAKFSAFVLGNIQVSVDSGDTVRIVKINFRNNDDPSSSPAVFFIAIPMKVR